MGLHVESTGGDCSCLQNKSRAHAEYGGRDMKLKFKVQPYQTNAVDAVADCFAG